MAYYGSDQIKLVLVGGWQLQPYCHELSEEGVEAVMEETNPLGSSWREYTPVGLRQHGITLGGLYDASSGGPSAALSTRLGSTHVVCYGVEGNDIGDDFLGFNAVEGAFNRTMGRGVLHRFTAALRGSGRFDEGKILKAYGHSTGSTGTSSASAVDNGSSTPAGGVAYFHISSINMDGATSFTAWVRHSSNGTVWADLTTFTGITSSVATYAAERIVTASATVVERHLTAAWAYNSTVANSSRTAEFFVGYARGSTAAT